MTFLQMQLAIASYLKQPLSAFIDTNNSYNFLQPAINQARHRAELLHDFYYAQQKIPFSIASTGSSITGAQGVGSVATVTGALSPNLTGTYYQAAIVNGAVLYVNSSAGFLIWSAGIWYLSQFSGAGQWEFTGTSSAPDGVYTAVSPATGAATVASSSPIAIKRIRHVSLTTSDGNLLPIEYMTQEELNDRIKRQAGRQPFVTANTLAQYGISAANPTAYQDGQNLYLYPSSMFTFPVTVSLDVIQFQPDYVNNGDSDFFLQNCADYIQWQAIVDGNRYWKELIPRQEGNIQEQSATDAAGIAFEAMLKWDADIRGSTSTPVPEQQPQPQSK